MFRKSSYSNSQGACVEVDMEFIEAASWRTACGSMNGECIEVGHGPAVVGVRDTKDNGTGPILKFTGDEWGKFLHAVKGNGVSWGKREGNTWG